MEILLYWFALLFVLLLLAAPFVVLALRARVLRLEARLESLEELLREAKRERASGPGAFAQARPATGRPQPASTAERFEPRTEAASERDARAEPGARVPSAARAEPASEVPQAEAPFQEEPRDLPPRERSAPAPGRPSPRPRIEWEKWIGVRGAALLGGILLALAGLLFFKHSLEQGWVTPRMRVLNGSLVGLGALVASELLRRREFRFAPAAVAGAGVVILFATCWASYGLYGFLPALVALPLMALLTATCAWFALRLESQFVAVLGLVGGFATPLLLSMPAEHPLGLFGYLLLLDLGLLALGQRLKSTLLASLGLIATFVVEAVWISTDFDVVDYPLVLISMGAFGVLFLLAGGQGKSAQHWGMRGAQAGALLFPIVFGIYFAGAADFGASLWPLAVLMGVLGLGAQWCAVRQGAPQLATGAAAGSVAIVATWFFGHHYEQASLWEFAFCSLGLSALAGAAQHFLRSATEPSAPVRGPWLRAPTLLGLGFLLVMLPISLGEERLGPWAWLLAALGQAWFLHFQFARPGGGWLRVVSACLAGGVLGFRLGGYGTGDPGPLVSAAWPLGAALSFAALATFSARRDGRREARCAWHAAASFSLLFLLLGPVANASSFGLSALSLALQLSLALLVLRAASALSLGSWSAAALLLLAVKRLLWARVLVQDPSRADVALELCCLEWGGYALLAALPLLARNSLGRSQGAWEAVGLFLWLSLLTSDRMLGLALGANQPWQAPIVHAALALGLGVCSRYRLPSEEPVAKLATRWLLGVGLGLFSLGLARLVGHGVLPVTAALWGLGLALLWRKLPSLPLKAATCATIALGGLWILWLVLSGFGGEQHFPVGDWLLWNWTSYISALPALGAFAAARALRPLEAAQATPQERKLPRVGSAWASSLLMTWGLLLSFVWLNLQVLHHFESEAWIRFQFDSLPARDLTLSISWILFALLLLAGGMLRNVSALRQASLACLLLTLIKLFLHDLGDLRGLYRVASILGLGVSLLLVSLLYQRFVFPRKRTPEALEEVPGEGP